MEMYCDGGGEGACYSIEGGAHSGGGERSVDDRGGGEGSIRVIGVMLKNMEVDDAKGERRELTMHM